MKHKTAKANVRTRTRLFSLLLAVLMTLFCFPVTALGGGESDSESASVVPDAEQNSAGTASDEEFFGEVEEFIPWELELEEGDLDLLTLKTAELDPSEKPEIISYALIEEKQHVNRLYEQEPDVFTIMFQNRDGGKTVYVFSHPVKTVSPSGVYTDMTAAQIQAAVNSTSASTNATGIASSSLSLTASGSKMQIALGSDFIKSRLGNLDAEKPIMSYNIGEFVIFKARASTLTNGISDITYDVTDEAREWATPGSEVPKFTFVPEISDTQIEADDNVSLGGSVGIITPTVEEEIVVMSLAYSLAAGQYSMKSISDGKFLFATTTERILTGSTLYVPDGKWHFQYLSNGKYYIKPLTRQNMFLSCYEDSLCLLPQADSEDEPQPTMWTLNLQSNSTGYIHTSDSMYISSGLNMVPGVEENISMWQLGNHDDAELVRSITISNIMISPGESVDVPVIAKSPDVTAYTSNDEYFEWVSLDSENIGYNIDDGFYANETYGVYRIYCRYKFNPEIVSNIASIYVVDITPDLLEGVSIIRNPNANTSVLTMNLSSNGSTSLSMATFEGTEATANNNITVKDAWYDRSQAFNITSNGDGTYRISAIMSTKQYNSPYLTYNGTFYPYNGTYELVDENTQPNTLSMTSDHNIQLEVYNENSASQKWKICFVNNLYYLVNSNYTEYFVSFNDTSITSNKVIGNNNGWEITYFGVDLPFIKQTTNYYCGLTSGLQIIHTLNPAHILNATQVAINNGVVSGNVNNLVTQQVFLSQNGNIPTTQNDPTSSADILEYLNSSLGTNYTRSSVSSQVYMIDKIRTTLSKGFPLIVSVNPSLEPGINYYYDSGTGERHFICILGYDTITGKIAVSDCHYDERYHGIHLIDSNELYLAIRKIVYIA